MIETTIISTSNKSYSVKYSINIVDENTADVRILNVTDVIRNSGTSFTRLKSVYQKDNEEQTFNTIKYKDVFNKLISDISRKYKVKNIRYN